MIASVKGAGSVNGTPCPSGYFCPLESSLSSKIQCSSSSQYCPGGTLLAQSVPSGGYLINCTDSVNFIGCSNYSRCEAGYFCQSGIRDICASGTFSNQTGSNRCVQCPAGYLSNETGSMTCTVCPLGSDLGAVTVGRSSCSYCSPRAIFLFRFLSLRH